MDIHKRLKMYTVPVLLIKALLVIGIHELQVLRKAKRSAVTRVSLGSRKVVTTDLFFFVIQKGDFGRPATW
jgi:hypothetical protein